MEERTNTTSIDIHERAMDFGVRAVRLFRHLQKGYDQASMIVAKQFLRSALSIGANMAEADSAESRLDFIHKCSVAQKEARETWYWLRVMVRASIVSPVQLDGLTDEARQITAIITSIGRNAKKKLSS
jgi:four helix bundle protein